MLDGARRRSRGSSATNGPDALIKENVTMLTGRPARVNDAPAAAAASAALLAVALAGCAVLPDRIDAPPSHAITQTADTALGRIASASLDGTAPGASGFRLLPRGAFALEARVALARRAERSLDVQYYQIDRDEIGLGFLRELAAAAARGVRVRLLVDDLYAGGEDELLRSMASLPSVEVRLFNPLPARGGTPASRVARSVLEFERINHRMHNKLFIADTRFSVSGGRNMASDYFMRNTRANFIDVDVVAAGPVVREQSEVFDMYWNSDQVWPIERLVPAAPSDDASPTERFARLAGPVQLLPAPDPSDPLGRVAVGLELDGGRVSLSFADAAVFADAPAKVVRRGRDENVATVSRSTIAALHSAKHEMVIASPYFIPGRFGMQSIQEARARGVRVAVFTNALGATDEPLVHWRYAHYRRALLRLGVELYELSPDRARESGRFGEFGASFARLHAKLAVIDRRHVFIGSLNLDPRSAWLNTEAGLLIHSADLASDIEKLIGNDRLTSVYRLRLAADGETIEWVTTADDNSERVLRDEPDDSWLHQLKMRILSPFAPEELL